MTPITVPIVRQGDGAVNRDDYLGWASSIAPQMVSALNASAYRRMSAIDGLINEDDRLAALRDMGVLNDVSNPRFDDVVEMARNLFGTDTAALSFIDIDRVWIKSFAGIDPGQLSRSEGVCALTIQRSELLVIEDLSIDPRYRSWVRRTGGPRFYAGYPIESGNGQRVGSLCLLDSKPRKFSERDHTLLRQLALRIQAIAGDVERRP